MSAWVALTGALTLWLAAGELRSVLGSPGAGAAGALLAASWLAWARRRMPRAASRRGPRGGPRIAALAVALATGLAAAPLLRVAVPPLGLALGLEPQPGLLPPDTVAPLAVWLLLMLGAAYEELFYRGILLEELERSLGRGAAALLSSLAFALPHGEAWRVLGAGVVGLALALAAFAWRSLAVCFALHAGVNTAVGLGGVAWPATPAALAAAAGAVLAGGLLLARIMRCPAATRSGIRA